MRLSSSSESDALVSGRTRFVPDKLEVTVSSSLVSRQETIEADGVHMVALRFGGAEVVILFCSFLSHQETFYRKMTKEKRNKFDYRSAQKVLARRNRKASTQLLDFGKSNHSSMVT